MGWVAGACNQRLPPKLARRLDHRRASLFTRFLRTASFSIKGKECKPMCPGTIRCLSSRVAQNLQVLGSSIDHLP